MNLTPVGLETQNKVEFHLGRFLWPFQTSQSDLCKKFFCQLELFE